MGLTGDGGRKRRRKRNQGIGKIKKEGGNLPHVRDLRVTCVNQFFFFFFLTQVGLSGYRVNRPNPLGQSDPQFFFFFFEMTRVNG